MRPSRLAIALALSLVVLATAGLQKAQPAFALTNCSVSDSFDSQEQAFLTLINNYRAQNGRVPLTASTNLNRGAGWMAQDLGTKNYFSHTDSLGRSAQTRLGQCDATPNFGENIAAGTYRSTAQEAFNAWRASSGHNANMLNSSYKQIGIARYYNASSRYRWYWVTDFSTSNDGTNAGGGSTSSPSPTPSPSASPSPSPTSSPAPTATAPPPSSPVQGAQLSSPANGSTLGSSAVFSWNGVSGALAYRIDIGTSPGASNMLRATIGASVRSVRISGFPSSGATIYFRLWTQLSSGWVYRDYTFQLSS
jgi:uncharacterized protein YkwD